MINAINEMPTSRRYTHSSATLCCRRHAAALPSGQALLHLGTVIHRATRRLHQVSTWNTRRVEHLSTFPRTLVDNISVPFSFLFVHQFYFQLNSYRRRFYPQRPPGQAVVTGVALSPSPYTHMPCRDIAQRVQHSHCSSL